MKAFKFMIPTDRWYSVPGVEGIDWKGCLAIATAETKDDAIKVIENYALEQGHDARWLQVARVIVIDVKAEVSAMLGWAQI